jgi:hypothetical protein
VSQRRSRAGWLCLVLFVPAAFFVVGFLTRADYGETYDEDFDKSIGRYYYFEYPEKGVAGLSGSLGPLKMNYGPLFSTLAVATTDVLIAKTHLMKDGVAAPHMAVLASCTLAMVLIAVFAFRRFGPLEALFSACVLATLPQVVAHSQSNLKDTPLMLLFAASVIAFDAAIRSGRLWSYAFAGCLVGVTYAVKLNAVVVYLVAGVYFVAFVGRTIRDYRRFALGCLVALSSSIATIPVLWPYYRVRTWERFPETVHAFKTWVFDHPVLYMGHFHGAHAMPWHFPFVHLAVSTPLFVLAFGASAVVLLVRSRRTASPEALPLGLLFVWLLLPLGFHSASGAPMYDGMRHFLMTLPAMALLAGVAMGRFVRASFRRGAGAGIAAALALATGFGVLLRTLWALHPYHVVFYNSLVGGTKGAAKLFELDPWGQSYREAARWINSHTPPGSRVFVPFGDHFFPLDEAHRFVVHDTSSFANYKVHLLRGMLLETDPKDYPETSRRPVFSVSRSGADLLRIYELSREFELPDGASVAATHSSNGAAGDPGLLRERFAGGDEVTAVERSVVPAPEFDSRTSNAPWREERYLLRTSGRLLIEKSGPVCFQVESDDQSILRLDGKLAVVCESERSARKTLNLAAGLHGIQIDLRNDAGPSYLRVRLGAPGTELLDPIPSRLLTHEAGPSRQP